jgi:hypothetical protein
MPARPARPEGNLDGAAFDLALLDGVHEASVRECHQNVRFGELFVLVRSTQRRLLRRTWARTSAPSLMLRTASARPFPAASGEDGAVIAAGMSTTVASSRKSGMPSRRARTDA